MAQNVTIMGASYSAVPAVTLPKTGGGTARFDDASVTTATASDVASGKVFVAADGTITTGTGSGGGDSLIVTLSWDDDYFGADEGAWVPDCTFAEIQAAYQAGKTIVVRTDVYADAYCSVLDMPTWLTYEVAAPQAAKVFIYELNSNSLQLVAEVPIIVPNFDSPTRTYTPTTSQQTETITYDPNDGFNGIEQVSVTVNAMPTGTAGTPTATKGTVSNHSVSVTPSVTNTTGYITGSTKTGTAVSVTASELVSGTYTVTGSGTANVTNYASASVAAGGATASATKGAVSNHAVTVTPSVTRTAGWVTAGTASGTAVTVSASELVSGSETKTANGTYDVTNLAQLVVDVQGGGGSGMQVATATATPSTASTSIQFTGLQGEPTSFYVMSVADLATGASPYKVAAVVYDGTDHHAQIVTNTSNAQATYDGATMSHTYSNGTLTVTSSSHRFQAVQYKLVYTHGGNSANIGTSDVQVGSGATSIAFTGLTDEPTCWSVIFKSNFSTSSGYQRVMAVANDGNSTYGVAMGSGAVAESEWTSSYSNGTLTISSTSTSAGGYFHQPGYYQLTYGIGGEAPEIDIEPLTVTQNGVYSESGKAYSPVTVNVSGGGGASVDVTTWTNNSTSTVSHQFTGLKGTPKAAFLRCTSQLTRSSSNTYYYIADIVWDGTNAYGNYHLRSNGSYNNVASDAQSGFNVTVGTNSITFSSDATSRSSAPGSFYNGSYELLYCY